MTPYDAPVAHPARKRPRRGLLILIVGVALVLLGAAAVVFVLLDRDSDHPDEWDSRVADLIPIVEKERGLEFEHPVHVDFRSEKDFRKDMTADEGDLTQEDKDELDQTSGLLRALGLLKSDVDLFKEMNALTGDGTLGFYSFEDKRIRVRGDKMTPAVTKTLVHELTHALQDQHFDLGKKFDELDEDKEGTAAAVYRGLVEGDASRIESAYVASLPAKEQESLQKSQETDQGEMLKKLDKIPQILVVLMSTPYALGQPLVTLAAAEEGNKSVDKMFGDPPSTEEHLLDPWTWVNDQEPAIKVDEPKVPTGEKEFDSGEFGALFLYLVLAEHLPLTDALEAADGWGGDHYVAFEKDDKTCITSDFIGDSDKDTAEIDSALTSWSKALPDGAAQVTRNGKTVRLESCDSGDDSRLGSDSSQEALQLVTVRSSLGAQLLQSGAPAAMAQCYSAALATEYSVEQLTDPEFGVGDPEVMGRIQELATTCQ
ncbi:hypothetical protein BJ980_002969 [Nocardioides daedukensis]|uniref:DUF4157 domain-containing protein n=1 Tax=Nocardioides daedukensis TaxID=634462 RepID=A0A7Y9S2E6_9ACTN|nr:hypothetical protein [Nocardioides daedukensis]NYG60046.1 hypothetical protein [Nocardioides daedukensis]